MPQSQRAILDALKRNGGLGVDELALELGITVSGTRGHLSVLERQGLIVRGEERNGPGRPRLRYTLTSLGDALYPRTYAELANELLACVADDDPTLLERVFARRAIRRLERAQGRLREQPSFEARVFELARILDEDGYLAAIERLEDGSYRLTEHNCAVLAVALKYGHACSSELDFLCAALPEATIERVSHIVAGAHACAYLIRPS